MQGAKDLIASERGWFVLAVLVVSTALVVVGKLTGTDWKAIVMVLGGLLVAGKTATGAIETLTNKATP
jgi:hypothetical protein